MNNQQASYIDYLLEYMYKYMYMFNHYISKRIAVLCVFSFSKPRAGI